MNKRIISSIIASATVMVALADGTFHLSGCIKGVPSGDVLVYNETSEASDTLHLAKDGTFSQDLKVDKPTQAILIISDLKLTKNLFLEAGKSGDVQGAVVKTRKDGKDEYALNATYKGDNQDVAEYIDTHTDFDVMDKWPFERIDTVDFATYREKLLEDIDCQKREVNKLSNMAFRRMTLEKIDAYTDVSLCRWAWKKNLTDDPNFRNWIESFDRNDPKNIQAAANYDRWYRRLHKGATGGNYYAYLKTIFSNQDVVNQFADETILQELRQAPDDMEQQLANYLAVSTNEKAKAEAKAVYEQYKNLKKGGDAKDFTMQDAKGKTYSFKDFRGKMLVIDVWATWCGPCCAQIPHYAKLVEQFKGNKNVEFISISLDSDKQKWLRKVAQDKPKWKQFICPDDFKSDLCKNYDINAIPRFMVFSKDGKVVDLDAPVPSSGELKTLIEKNL